MMDENAHHHRVFDLCSNFVINNAGTAIINTLVFNIHNAEVESNLSIASTSESFVPVFVFIQ
jgi:hypothetical protein